MVKYVCKYADEKIFSVYTKGITESITMRFIKVKSYSDVIFLPTERPTKLLIE
jgi:hypothetical protein